VGPRDPNHPLKQTIDDCLTEAMDIDGLKKLRTDNADSLHRPICRSRRAAAEIQRAAYAFLDNAP
jgi:ATP-dependent Lhr-like helicase